MSIFSIRIRFITLIIVMVVFTSILQISVLRIYPILPFGIGLLILTVWYKFSQSYLHIAKKELQLLLPLFLAVIFSLPPIIINHVLYGFFNYLGLLIVSCCIIFLLSNNHKSLQLDSLNNTLIIITFFVVITSIIIDGIYFNRYLGIFNNPNNTGAFASSILTYLVSFLIVSKINKFPGKNNSVLIVASIVLFSMLIASTSRGSLLSFFAGIFIVYCTSLVRKKSKQGINSRDLRKAVILSAIFIVIILALYWGGAFNKFILKLSARKAQYGKIDPRIHIWTTLVNNLKFWGIGDTYSKMLHLDYGAHNTFLSQAVRYGIPAALFYLIFILSMLWFAFKNVKGKDGLIAILSIGVGVSYFVRALFETVAASPDFWIFLILGFLVVAKKRRNSNIDIRYSR